MVAENAEQMIEALQVYDPDIKGKTPDSIQLATNLQTLGVEPEQVLRCAQSVARDKHPTSMEVHGSGALQI